MRPWRASVTAVVLAMAVAVCLPAPSARGGLVARVTWYAPTGNPTASGLWPGPGTAACSDDLPLWTVVRVYDRRGGSELFTCLDRGQLAPTWLDLYDRPDAPETFGDWTVIAVERGQE